MPHPPFPTAMALLSELCCDCGQPEIFYTVARDTLAAADLDAEPRVDLYANPALYFAANVLDEIGLLEHGGSIGAAWRTPLGDDALAFLRLHGVDWFAKGLWVDAEGATWGYPEL